jgi:hypothetical protein
LTQYSRSQLTDGTTTAAHGMFRCTDRRRDYERALIERERTISGLETRLARIAAELTDAEVMRLIRAMLDARAAARRASQERLASSVEFPPAPFDSASEIA